MQPVIILVRPQMGENIGMVARAMLNCGLTELRLVAPRDGWPSESAMATSSGATEVIENAKLYNTLDGAIADCRYVLATGSFDRDMVKDVLSPEAAIDVIQKEAGPCAIVFGPERSGMDNEDVVRCDAYITIPLNPDYPSLNLAQAVLLVAYQWWRRVSVENNLPVAGGERLDAQCIVPATKEQLSGLFDHMTEALDQSGFFPTEQQRPVMLRNLRNTFHRLRLSAQEVNTFRGALKSLFKERI